MTTTETDLTHYCWLPHPQKSGEKLYDIGIRSDGSLHNPRGYDPDLICAAIAARAERKQASDAYRRAPLPRDLR